jgi:hypothetical protein
MIINSLSPSPANKLGMLQISMSLNEERELKQSLVGVPLTKKF